MTGSAAEARPAPWGLVLLTALVAWALLPGPASSAAAQQAASDGGAWQVPRTPDGHPDLQGNWTNATLTPFEREEGRGAVYTPAEVAEIERGVAGCPANPGTVECGRPDNQGDASLSNEARLSGAEYNEVFWNRGSRIALVDGEARTSLVTRPPTGRIPSLTAEGERLRAEERGLRGQFGPYDHPELRPLSERCMSTRAAGPPMVSGGYNNNYTIVQNADHVMIVTEMVHDVRVVRLGEVAAPPKHVRFWHGDSRGHWEGETLVVRTSNFHVGQELRGAPASEDAEVIERFTRTGEDTILYEFTIDDPAVFTEPWGGEIPFTRFDDLLYEYACHEGNYSFSGVLSGARYVESQGSEGR